MYTFEPIDRPRDAGPPVRYVGVFLDGAPAGHWLFADEPTARRFAARWLSPAPRPVAVLHRENVPRVWVDQRGRRHCVTDRQAREAIARWMAREAAPPDIPRNLLGEPEAPPLTGRQLALDFPAPGPAGIDAERQAAAWAAKRDQDTRPMFPNL